MPTTTQPVAIIPEQLAKDRVDYYLDKKKVVMDGLLSYKDEVSQICYSVPAFLALMDKFVHGPRTYSGVRTYFASHKWDPNDPGSIYIPSELTDNLTIIYVPTYTVTNPDGSVIQQDDTDQCYIIFNNMPINLRRAVNPIADTPANWIGHFRKKLDVLNLDGIRSTNNPLFLETKSIWYSMSSLVSPDPNNIGLLAFIQQLQQNGAVKKITAKFACYIENDTFDERKLTVVYELTSVEKGLVSNWFFGTPAASPSFGGSNAKAKLLSPGDPDADTGLPCPPEANCGGSGFPNP